MITQTQRETLKALIKHSSLLTDNPSEIKHLGTNVLAITPVASAIAATPYLLEAASKVGGRYSINHIMNPSIEKFSKAHSESVLSDLFEKLFKHIESKTVDIGYQKGVPLAYSSSKNRIFLSREMGEGLSKAMSNATTKLRLPRSVSKEFAGLAHEYGHSMAARKLGTPLPVYFARNAAHYAPIAAAASMLTPMIMAKGGTRDNMYNLSSLVAPLLLAPQLANEFAASHFGIKTINKLIKNHKLPIGRVGWRNGGLLGALGTYAAPAVAGALLPQAIKYGHNWYDDWRNK